MLNKANTFGKEIIQNLLTKDSPGKRRKINKDVETKKDRNK